MVKRVAQALQQEMGTAPFDETATFALAHAAIAAMREPTEEMLDAWIGPPPWRGNERDGAQQGTG
jgi:hypothetical protein